MRSEDRSRRDAQPEGVARALSRRDLPSAAVLVVVVEVVRGARGAAGGVRASRRRLPEDVRGDALVKSGGALVEVDHRSEVVGVRAAHDEPAAKLAPRGSGLGARGSGGRRGVEPSRRGRGGVVLAIVHRRSGHRHRRCGNRQICVVRGSTRGFGRVRDLGRVGEHRHRLTPVARAAARHEPGRGGRRHVLLRGGPSGEALVQRALESLDLRLGLVPGFVHADDAADLDAVELLLVLGHRAGRPGRATRRRCPPVRQDAARGECGLFEVARGCQHFDRAKRQ